MKNSIKCNQTTLLNLANIPDCPLCVCVIRVPLQFKEGKFRIITIYREVHANNMNNCYIHYITYINIDIVS